jgi:hypothetical protein
MVSVRFDSSQMQHYVLSLVSSTGAAWHLDHVEIRRLLKGQKTKTYVFPCDRWFAKNEDDRNIVRELVPERVIEEKLNKKGQLQVQEKDVHDRLESKDK